MLILGLLLVLVSAAAVALLVAYNTSGGPEQMIVLFGRDLVSVTPMQAFLSGVVAALVFCLGVWMIVTTERRRRVARAQYRDARREARIATKERDKLAKQLADMPETTTEPERPAGWTPPEAVASTPETSETEPEHRRRFGRHWRKDRADEAQAEHTTAPPPK